MRGEIVFAELSVIYVKKQVFCFIFLYALVIVLASYATYC